MSDPWSAFLALWDRAKLLVMDGSTFAEFAWLSTALVLIGAASSFRRAPAVGLALSGALAFGILGMVAAHGREVPAVVAAWGTFGLVGLGVVGLFLSPQGSARSLWWATLVAVVVSPVILSIIWFQMRTRCPAYDPATSRFCAGTDVFFGVSGIVMFYACLGVLVLIGLFVSSALKAKTRERSSSTGSIS